MEKEIRQKERSRDLSALASEQLTAELSQGVLVARHVDRPWQEAWVHVAQLELSYTSDLQRIREERGTEEKRGACCSEQHQTSGPGSPSS